MTLDSTIGGAAANSYASVSEADAYFATRLYADSWTDAGTSEKEQALITTTQEIESYYHPGTRVSTTQALQWPRYNVYFDGLILSSETIPTLLKYAQYEGSIYLLANTSVLEVSELRMFDNLKVGSIDITPHHPVSTPRLPARAISFLQQLGVGVGSQAQVIRS